MTSYYLLLDLSIVVPPIVLSVNRKVNFFSKWNSALLVSGLLAVVFLLVALFFTKNGILELNPVYCVGIKLAQVPFEEMLFFFVTPFAALFVYENSRYYFRNLALTWLNRILILINLFYLCTMLWFVEVDWYLMTLISASIAVLIWWMLTDSLKMIGVTYLLTLVPALFAHSMIRSTSERTNMQLIPSDVSGSANWLNYLELILFSFTLVTASILIYEINLKRKYK